MEVTFRGDSHPCIVPERRRVGHCHAALNSRIWFFFMLLTIERFCSYPVRAGLTNRLRPRLSADAANLFCMLGPVNGFLDRCHLSVFPLADPDCFPGAYRQDGARSVGYNLVGGGALQMSRCAQVACRAANTQHDQICPLLL